MANYAKTTDFATKDGLPTGDPLKIIKGTEIDDEFEAIETAINSKVDTIDSSVDVVSQSIQLTSLFLGQSYNGWKIAQVGSELILSFNGTDKYKFATDGTFTVL